MIPRVWAGLALALVVLNPLVWAQGPETKPRPNLLLIVMDDVGLSDLGFQGGEIRTPNLDALAAGGVRFTDFYNSARCCPSRASLLTGVYPAQAGFPDMTGRLPAHVVTIPEVLKPAGYTTFMVGKWHLSSETKPTDRGFDEFYGMLGGFNSYWREDPFYTRWPLGRIKRLYAAGGFYATDVLGDYALDFMEQGRRAGQPWFLYLAFNAAHFPLHAPRAEVDRLAAVYERGWDVIREERLARMKALGLIPADLELPPRLVVPRNWANARKPTAGKQIPAWVSLPEDRRRDLARRMAVYAAMIEHMDRTIGRVVERLKATHELENTLIMVLSDNGACGEWDPFGFDGESGPGNILHTGEDLAAMGGPLSYMSYGSGWASACVTPYRYYKQYTHEGGVRTPFLVHFPAGTRLRPGSAIHRPSSITDVMFTCVEAAGAEYPREHAGVAILPGEGVSLLPLLRGDPVAARRFSSSMKGARPCVTGFGNWSGSEARAPGSYTTWPRIRPRCTIFRRAIPPGLRLWKPPGMNGPGAVGCLRPVDRTARRIEDPEPAFRSWAGIAGGSR